MMKAHAYTANHPYLTDGLRGMIPPPPLLFVSLSRLVATGVVPNQGRVVRLSIRSKLGGSRNPSIPIASHANTR
jgi:hypothetical protein